MITLIYLVILIFGCVSLWVLIRGRKRFSKNRQIVLPSKVELTVTPEPTAEYEALLESSSKLIKTLSQLEHSLPIKILLSVCSAALLFLLNLTGLIELDTQSILLVIAIFIVIIIVVPGMLHKMAVASETKKIMEDIPAFIDLVAVGVQSGMTIESALTYTTKKFVNLNKSLTVLMDRVMRRAEVSGLDNALKDLVQSMPTIEIKMFCSSLRQSIHFGTSVYEQLIDLSKDIRDLQLLATEERIAKLAAKITAPLMLFLVVPTIVLFAAPQVMRALAHV